MDRITQPHRLRRLALLGRFAVAGVALASALPVAAAEFIVTTTTDTNAMGCSAEACSLREAILAANAAGTPSTIRLGAGNHTITIAGANENDGLLGDFDITGDVTIVGTGIATTRIGTVQLGEQIIDIAAGAKVRFENLSIGVGVRTGYFGSGVADDTVLEISQTTLGGSTPNGSSINARGSVSISDSTVTGGTISSGHAAIRLVGKRLDITRSVINAGYFGIVAWMNADSSFTLADSTVNGSGQRNLCATMDIRGASSIVVTRSQAFGSIPAELAPSCLRGDKIVVRDSAFSARFGDYRALLVTGTALIHNTTIAGSILTGGDVTLEHVTVGGTTTLTDEGPYAIQNNGGTVTVSNSTLIGSCVGGGISALGNNVESPGNTCGLPAASSRVDQPWASLELGPLQTNGGTTVNYLPGNTSVLNSVFTADGIARCESVDQRGFLRAAACTIGAVETNATEQVLFRDGFDP